MAKVRVPAEPFNVHAVAHDAEDAPFRRTTGSLLQPQSVRVVPRVMLELLVDGTKEVVVGVESFGATDGGLQ